MRADLAMNAKGLPHENAVPRGVVVAFHARICVIWFNWGDRTGKGDCEIQKGAQIGQAYRAVPTKGTPTLLYV
jgi:hypothetical protein